MIAERAVVETAVETFTFRQAPTRYFWERLLASVPVNHAMWRTCEATGMAGLQVTRPILDIGCGDGLFASIMFTEPVDMGIDLWPGRLLKAQKRGVYRAVRQANALALPFEDASYGTVFSNCVLEHIEQLDRACCEVARVLRPGGYFVFTVPTGDFARLLLHPRWLRRIGLGWLGQQYVDQLNRVFHHYHCETPEVWTRRLGRCGLDVERCRVMLPPDLEAVWDALMPIGGLQLLMRKTRPDWTFPFQQAITRLATPWILTRAKAQPIAVGGNMLVIARKPER